MGLIEEISQKQIVLVVFQKADYLTKSLEIIKSISEVSQKTCYVALNKPYNAIIDIMNQNNVDVGKFFFIDVLTATVQTPPQVENCTFVESPNALTDLSLSFTEAMNEKGCDNALFDSISSLIIHDSEAGVIKLAQNLMTKVRVTGKKAVFICLKEDSEALIKDLTMFVDGIVNL